MAEASEGRTHLHYETQRTTGLKPEPGTGRN